MIVVIDYGMGNLKSVENAFRKYTDEVVVTDDYNTIKNAEKLVLPGVGSFGKAMENIDKLNLRSLILEKVNANTPLIGICLGLQLLFDTSEESPGVEGLGIIPGSVKRFSADMKLKVPQIGWNSVVKASENVLLDGVKNDDYFYFVHSFYVDPIDKNVALTKTEYGIEYVSSIQKSSVVAFQFHPEKSHNIGLSIIENFINL